MVKENGTFPHTANNYLRMTTNFTFTLFKIAAMQCSTILLAVVLGYISVDSNPILKWISLLVLEYHEASYGICHICYDGQVFLLKLNCHRGNTVASETFNCPIATTA